MNSSTYLIIIFSLLALNNSIAATNGPNTATKLGNVKGGDFKQAHSIISSKCSTCHSINKIDLALSAGKDMSKIQLEMEKRGAKLNTKEREVLGIYWKQGKPLKSK
ncbi:MAG: hypothetical protein A2X82_10435 [Geobacteraceae bacterium GWC2_55_20]|nr:MAG: hypothetical protein A2X82_10435 [Geobacteraceae bacterium GWC2_55_20]OGU22962.1 MAG: hypothetical protein A2X85_08555 [Geobacteraceae bacterium GWF2_54_21]HBA72692.1 cytochrome C [Geobacter sp.]HCE69494.1 cytochrome C [Geobacter sp.]